MRILELSEMKFFGILVSYLLFLKLVHLPFLIPTAFTITIFAVPLLLFAIYNLLEDNRISAYIFILLAAIILPALTMWFAILFVLYPIIRTFQNKERFINAAADTFIIGAISIVVIIFQWTKELQYAKGIPNTITQSIKSGLFDHQVSLSFPHWDWSIFFLLFWVMLLLVKTKIIKRYIKIRFEIGELIKDLGLSRMLLVGNIEDHQATHDSSESYNQLHTYALAGFYLYLIVSLFLWIYPSAFLIFANSNILLPYLIFFSWILLLVTLAKRIIHRPVELQESAKMTIAFGVIILIIISSIQFTSNRAKGTKYLNKAQQQVSEQVKTLASDSSAIVDYSDLYKNSITQHSVTYRADYIPISQKYKNLWYPLTLSYYQLNKKEIAPHKLLNEIESHRHTISIEKVQQDNPKAKYIVLQTDKLLDFDVATVNKIEKYDQYWILKIRM